MTKFMYYSARRVRELVGEIPLETCTVHSLDGRLFVRIPIRPLYPLDVPVTSATAAALFADGAT